MFGRGYSPRLFLLLTAVRTMPPVLQTDGIDVVEIIPLFLFANAKEKDGQKEKGLDLRHCAKQTLSPKVYTRHFLLLTAVRTMPVVLQTDGIVMLY